ncbi:ATP:cob(I)alamin adenosyltransferase [bacterium K02(2017)]|nr:ATP:cob(I)alamin adenosyltransferase [bacterium K02(2017)]
MAKIYTKTGDQGQTSLFDGTRVGKDHERIDLYGEVDELNSMIGLTLSFLDKDAHKQPLLQVQRDLFALGAKLANPADKKQKEKSDFDHTKIEYLEAQIDQMTAVLPALKSFILPGGNQAAASLHLARCICRRAERNLVKILNNNTLDELYLQYLNRLSDYLFVMARLVNFESGLQDTAWE